MSVQPVAILALAGADIASGPGGSGLMALDGASVKWGRTDVLAQPSPATATVQVLDPAGTWAATAGLVGQPVTLRWSWAGESRVYFRGRVASVQVEPFSWTLPGGSHVDGARVSLAATSVLADLGNRRPTDPTVAWPAEPLATRRDRIAAQCAPVLSAIRTRPLWDPAPLASIDKPGDAKMLQRIPELFANCGADRFTYDPDAQTIDWVGRRSFDPAVAAHLVRDSSRVGVYVTGPTVQRSPTDPAEPAVSIPASVVQGTLSAGQAMDSKLTRVTLTYPGTGQGFTVLTAGLDESVVGIRSLDVGTQHTDDTTALTAANDLSAMVSGEASGWTLGDPMRWDTERTGGFDTIAQARLLLAGAERTGVFWLAGSWLPALGVLPLFGVMGATITCRRGAWVIDWTVAPTSTTAPVTGLVPDTLDASIVWTDTDDPAGLHTSVTADDLAAVGTGNLTIGA